MPQQIPFMPSNPNYQLVTDIDGDTYLLDVRWNDREGCEGWYFDLREEDGTYIASGLRIVLGAYIGRHIDHKLFRNGVLVATDSERTKREAGLDDISTRVPVHYWNVAEIFGSNPEDVVVID